MDRVLNLSPCCEIISIIKRWLQHSLIEEITLIIEFKGSNFIIQDELEKVLDVSYMPVYIKEDWINYNKKPIDKHILIEHIKEYEEKVNWQWPPDENTKQSLEKLKAIKRDQIINKII
jgi:hypothetical protein